MSAKRSTDVSASSKERNEYIPSFIAKKPFYVAEDEDSTAASGSDYLEHQRLQSTSTSDQKWYDRGKKLGPAATKFRKGACENCGAITHKTKECLNRKRKHGARWTGRDIQADEIVQNVNLGWDAKRDRWNGYDAKEYDGVVEDFNLLEEMKRRRTTGAEIKNNEDEEGEPDVGTKYDEETDMGRQQSTSTRNLRLREDTAKYLLNLDLESAKYDPKTRSMVDSGAIADQAAALIAEEGFIRASGDAAEFERAQRYAWEASERGDGKKIHLQANPTAGEILRRKEKEDTELKREVQKKALLEKYGGQQHLQSNPVSEAGIIESERYVEYDERGRIKGATATKIKSQYRENVLINNHTSVWGSWWTDFRWGYACCHSTVKNSYCTGDDGRKALEAAERQKTGAALEDSQKFISWQDEEVLESHDGAANQERKNKTTSTTLKRPPKSSMDTRDGVTEEEMEEFRRKRIALDDPMAKQLGRDELVH